MQAECYSAEMIERDGENDRGAPEVAEERLLYKRLCKKNSAGGFHRASGHAR